MRGVHLIGILLTLAGIALAATSSFSFEESKGLLSTQNVDVYLKAQKTNTWPWLAGIVAVISGIAIFILLSKKKR
jgi:hypothetical protein